jgi:hypothetical protein
MVTVCSERRRDHILSVAKGLMVYQPDRTPRDATVHFLKLGTVQLHAISPQSVILLSGLSLNVLKPLSHINIQLDIFTVKSTIK